MHQLAEKVLKVIIENYKESFNKLNIESFDVYSFLNNEFKNTKDITRNYLFQFIFRSFYRLDNAGLTPEFKTRYFELLQEYRDKPIDLNAICIDLSDYKTRKGLNSIQFSFATKLANTIDDSYPIYDSEVIRLFNFKQPYRFEKDEKIKIYLEQYDYILSTSKKLITNAQVQLIFKEMNINFGESCIKMSETKKLDTLMWGIGKVLNDFRK
jgi:hypothetical protein